MALSPSAAKLCNRSLSRGPMMDGLKTGPLSSDSELGKDSNAFCGERVTLVL
jgi:hypothetical protein